MNDSSPQEMPLTHRSETMSPPLFETFATLIDVLRFRAKEESGAEPFHMLNRDVHVAETLTYEELDQRSLRIAAALTKRDQRGKPVLICLPSSLDYIAAFFGCLYAGAIAVPLLPPDGGATSPGGARVASVAADTQAETALGNTRVVGGVQATHLGDSLTWIDVESLDDEPLAEPVRVAASELAFLQYTSGSTSSPKGVMITHQNLMANLKAIAKASIPARFVGVSWLPFFHDMGLISAVIAPVYRGGRQYIMTPVSFLRDPMSWPRAMSRYGATVASGPDFGYSRCAEIARDSDEVAELDLSQMVTMLTGSEPVRVETLDSFCDAFAPAGFQRHAFQPCLGMSELTVMATAQHMGTEATSVLVSRKELAAQRVVLLPETTPDSRVMLTNGPVIDGHEVAIVAPGGGTEVLGEDTFGEICIAGPSVATGYWNRPEVSEAAFGRRIEGSELRWYTTGDGGFLHDGEVYVTGRLADLIIVRGQNHAPEDIEASIAACHDAIASAAAFQIGDALELAVVVGTVRRATYDEAEVRSAVASALSERHGLRADHTVVVKERNIPRTSSGKVQRHRCADLFAPGDEGSSAAGDTSIAKNAESTTKSQREIAEWITTRVAAIARVPAENIAWDAPYSSFGLDSAAMLTMLGDLERLIGRPVPETLMLEHPCIAATLDALAGSNDRRSEVSAAPVSNPVGDQGELAIVGISCRLPGASNNDALWSLLSNRECMTGADVDRTAIWSGERPELTGLPGLGGFIENVERFDHAFFRMGEEEASVTDPQQRLALELAFEAIEDAGADAAMLADQTVGVFVGVSATDFAELSVQVGSPMVAIGNAHSIVANRISYSFGLTGPSMAIDTACSSSAVAIHQASLALRNGDCDLALVGGVNIVLVSTVGDSFEQAGLLSPDGRSKAFDERADGFVRSEGGAFVLLRRADDAVAAGDRVYASIIGSAVNNDGPSNGIYAPNGAAQVSVIQRALQQSRIEADDVTYVEAHGTGTALGDAVESSALRRVFSGRKGEPVIVGSAKANVGHLEAAAGIVGVVKTALALHNGVLPATPHTREPTADFGPDTPLALAIQPAQLDLSDGPVVAGVSSFGFGGTNAHIVMQSHSPVTEDAPHIASQADEPSAHLLVVSAASRAGLRAQAAGLRDRACKATADESVEEFCQSLARRTLLGNRAAATVTTWSDVDAVLAEIANGADSDRILTGTKHLQSEPRVVALFSGSGGSWAGMATSLYHREPVFRTSLEASSAVVEDTFGWSIRDLVAEGISEELVQQTAIVQPVTTAIQIAMWDLLQHWGVTPSAVLGHSYGEVAACYAAGSLERSAAMQVSVQRAKHLGQHDGQGSMAVVDCGEVETRALLGERADVFVAATNDPGHTVISGCEQGIEQLAVTAAQRGHRLRPIQVSVAAHTPLLADSAAALKVALSDLTATAPALPLWSTVTAELADGVDATYWEQNLLQPVRFTETLAAILADGPCEFVEIATHPILGFSIDETAAAVGVKASHIATMRRNGDASDVLETIGALVTKGAACNLRKVTGVKRHTLDLPTYPWQRVTCWMRPAQRSATQSSPPLSPAPAAGRGPALASASWEPIDALPESAESRPTGSWLVIGGGETGAACVGQLTACGLDARHEVDGACANTKGRSYVVKFLDQPTSVASLTSSCVHVVETLKAFAADSSFGGLWLATTNATQPVAGGRVDPWQSALAGFVRSLALEEPKLVLGQVDIDGDDPLAASALADALRSDVPEMSIRMGTCYVPTFETAPPAPIPIAAECDPTRPILITGGLGGLALEVARGHAETVGSPIVLVGRRTLEATEASRPGTCKQVESIRALGVEVTIACVDLADRRQGFDQLRAVLNDLAPVQKAYHLAGFSAIQEWRSLDRNVIEQTLGAKVNGALILEDVFTGQPDCEIVHFSSISSAWGSEFLAPYAASNAFLDGHALACDPNGPTIRSLHWGPWATTGMTARAGTADLLSDIGIKAYQPAQALQVLAAAESLTSPTVVCADLDWDLLSRLRSISRPLDSRFASMAQQALVSTSIPPASASAPEEVASPPACFDADPVTVARSSWESVLGLDEIPVGTTFLDLGGDSLRAVQISRRIAEACQIDVPIEALFDADNFDDFCDMTGIVATPSVTLDLPPIFEASTGDVAARRAIAEDPTETYYPLSAAQRRIWFHEQVSPGSPAYHIPIGLDINGALDVERLRVAAARVVERHPTLRSSIVQRDGQTVQVVSPDASVDFTVFDRATDETYSDRDGFLIGEATRPFDLQSGPVLRVSVDRSAAGSTAMLNVHHLFADGWSLGVLLGELATFYVDPTAVVPAVEVTYQRHVDWENSEQADVEIAEALQYWRGHLDDVPPVIDFPLDWARSEGVSDGQTLQRFIDAGELAKIDALASEQRTSRFAVLAAAFSVVLSRLCSTNDVVFGTPVVGRRSTADEGVIGCYVNTVPLRVKLDENESFGELVGQLRTATLDAFRHSAVPFDRLVHELGVERHPGRPPLVQAMMTMENMPIPAMRLGDVEIEPVVVNTGAPKFDLEVLVSEEADGLLMCLEFDGAILGANTMASLLDALMQVLAMSSSTEIRALSLLSPENQRRAFDDGHSGPEPTDVDISFCEIFDEHAAETPDRVAITDGDGHRYTYADLRDRSRALAAALLDRGATAGGRVALHTRRNAEYLVALLAVLRTGSAFVPLDLTHTTTRRAQLLRLCDVDLVVVDQDPSEELLEALPRGTDSIVWSDATGTTDLPAYPDPASVAYVLFTSGSTGEPKGAMVKHRGMINHLRSKVEDLDLVATDRVAETARTSFDISIWQFLAALMVGATTVVLDEEAAADPSDLIDQLIGSSITVWEAVPTVLSRVLDRLEQQGRQLSNVRIGLATGEALAPSLARRWFEHFDVPLVNAYGPTECSDDVTHHVASVAPAATTLRMPIGLPIRGADLYILDDQLRPVPSGFVGELVVGGVPVGAGYLKDDERTNQIFVDLPNFAKAGVCYRTGDRVRRRDDGTIEFLGRKDQQVKVRGVRIEPGEVEAALAAHPSLAAAAVAAWKKPDGSYSLCGYALPKNGAVVSETELRKFLAARLPAAAVPSDWFLLEKMPLNAAGKIDRSLLPEPVHGSAAGPNDAAVVEGFGGDMVGDLVMAAWHDVIGTPVRDRHGDIFESGGDSLLAADLVARMTLEIGERLALADFLATPTPQGLVDVIHRTLQGGDETIPLTRSSAIGPHPLTAAQSDILMREQLVDGDTAYVIPGAIVLQGDVDDERLITSIEQIRERHQALRTVFSFDDEGKPVQVVLDAQTEWSVERIDVGTEEALLSPQRLAELINQRTTFDLALSPFHVALARMSDDSILLVALVHHIVADGWSMTTMLADLIEIYRSLSADETPPPTTHQVELTDVAHWEMALKDSPKVHARREYWTDTAQSWEIVDLPHDLPVDGFAVSRPAGVVRNVAVCASIVDKIRMRTGATAFMVLAAAWAAALGRLTGTPDIVTAVPIGHRGDPAVDGLIGLLVETLPLHIVAGSNADFDEIVGVAKKNLLAAQSNVTPGVGRLLGAQAGCNSMVVMRTPLPAVEIAGVRIEAVDTHPAHAKFDLTAFFEERADEYHLVLEYAADAFVPSTASRIAADVVHILERAANPPIEDPPPKSIPVEAASVAQHVGVPV